MQSLFPGLWLSEITPDLYKIDVEVVLPFKLFFCSWCNGSSRDLTRLYSLAFFSFSEDLDCDELKLFEEFSRCRLSSLLFQALWLVWCLYHSDIDRYMQFVNYEINMLQNFVFFLLIGSLYWNLYPFLSSTSLKFELFGLQKKKKNILIYHTGYLKEISNLAWLCRENCKLIHLY